jgi:hypothetical protein
MKDPKIRGMITMSFSIILSVRKYGGFYILKSKRTEIPGYEVRICLGWIAVSLLNPEWDQVLDSLMERAYGERWTNFKKKYEGKFVTTE